MTKILPSKPRQLIAIRSLTNSDLGIFAAHRQFTRSKQRAVNINAPAAEQILSPDRFTEGKAFLNCISRFGDSIVKEIRCFSKVHKNWRLGGKKLEGQEYAKLDSMDFLLLRTIQGNDGTEPVSITFVSKTTDRVTHAGIAAIIGDKLASSMIVLPEDTEEFKAMSDYCPSPEDMETIFQEQFTKTSKTFPPMPAPPEKKQKKKMLMKDKIRQPHILQKMLQVAGDLSAPAQLRFMETVESLASVLREILLETGRLVSIERNHARLWKSVAGKSVGFVDGGLANLSMLGSAPIAARVGGYTVTPGDHSQNRETFTMLKCLIDELYASDEDGVFESTFPDLGALRDAARISIEAAGVVQLLMQRSDLSWIMLHGSLVNPVSRYTDTIENGQIKHRFPHFSTAAIEILLPPEERWRTGRDRNFINTYLKQLELLLAAESVVCGVVERPGTTATVCHSILSDLTDEELKPLLKTTPDEWRKEFRKLLDPSGDEDMEGQRITDSLLFRCILEPGEAIRPVLVERNLLRKAPKTWSDVIRKYPKPMISYLMPSEWSAPIRIEMFAKDLPRFEETIAFIMHCSLLLPRYAFPVGLDIVDKYAKIPNWMSRPINTHIVVSSLKQALESEDSKLFDSLRRMLCDTGREWLFRPGIYR